MRRSPAEWILPLLIAAGAVATVFHHLNFSLWYDETFSYGLVRQPLPTFLGHYIWGSEANMVLYYAILRSWLWLTRLVGIDPVEVIVRFPSAVFAVASAIVVYFLGRRLVDPLAGFVAAGLLLANFLEVLLAQMARAYSLQVLLLALSWYALVALLETDTNRRRWWIAYTALGALAVYADLFSALVLVAQVVALVALGILPGPWQARVRASVKRLLVSYALMGLVLSPLLLDAVLHGGPNTWILPAHLVDIKTFFLFISGDNRIYERLLLGSAFLGGVLALLAAGRASVAPRLTRALPDALGSAVALGCWIVVPIALSFALTRPYLNLHLFFNRYLIVVVPPLCLLAGLGVAALRWRLAQLALAIALALAAWPQLPLYYRFAEVQDIRDPVRWVQQRYQPGDGLICDPVVQCPIPVSYYLDAYPGPAHFDAGSPGRFSWPDTSWIPVDRDRVLAYAAAHKRVFFIFGPLGNGEADAAEAKGLESALATRYTEIDHIKAHAAAADSTVNLYQVAP
jgi:hypothetical protein